MQRCAENNTIENSGLFNVDGDYPTYGIDNEAAKSQGSNGSLFSSVMNKVFFKKNEDVLASIF